MATIKYDAVATLRSTDRNGNEKKRYHKMGVVFEGDKGLSLKLDNIPVGFDGWIQFYDPKPKESQSGGDRPQSGNKVGTADDSDSIPF